MQHDKVQARVNKQLVTYWLGPLWQVQNQNSKFVVTPHCNTWCTILKLCDHPSFNTLLTNRANKHEIKQNEMRLWWNIIVRHQAGNSSVCTGGIFEGNHILLSFYYWHCFVTFSMVPQSIFKWAKLSLYSFGVWLPSERKWVLFSEIGYQFTSFASLYCNKMWINEEYEQQWRSR